MQRMKVETSSQGTTAVKEEKKASPLKRFMKKLSSKKSKKSKKKSKSSTNKLNVDKVESESRERTVISSANPTKESVEQQSAARKSFISSLPAPPKLSPPASLASEITSEVAPPSLDKITDNPPEETNEIEYDHNDNDDVDVDDGSPIMSRSVEFEDHGANGKVNDDADSEMGIPTTDEDIQIFTSTKSAVPMTVLRKPSEPIFENPLCNISASVLTSERLKAQVQNHSQNDLANISLSVLADTKNQQTPSENDLIKISLRVLADAKNAPSANELAKISLGVLADNPKHPDNSQNDIGKISLTVLSDQGNSNDVLPSQNDISKISLTALSDQRNSNDILPSQNDNSKISTSGLDEKNSKNIENDLAKISLSVLNEKSLRTNESDSQNDLAKISLTALNEDYGIIGENYLAKISLTVLNSNVGALGTDISLPTNNLNRANSINSIGSFNSLSSFNEQNYMKKIGYTSLLKHVQTKSNGNISKESSTPQSEKKSISQVEKQSKPQNSSSGISAGQVEAFAKQNGVIVGDKQDVPLSITSQRKQSIGAAANVVQPEKDPAVGTEVGPGLQRRGSVRKYEVPVANIVSLQRRVSVSKPISTGIQEVSKVSISCLDAASPVQRRESTFSQLQKTLEEYDEAKRIRTSPVASRKTSIASTTADASVIYQQLAAQNKAVVTAAVFISESIPKQVELAVAKEADNMAAEAKPRKSSVAEVRIKNEPPVTTSQVTAEHVEKELANSAPSIANMGIEASAQPKSKLIQQLQADSNGSQKTSIGEISQKKIVSRVSSLFEHQQSHESKSPVSITNGSATFKPKENSTTKVAIPSFITNSQPPAGRVAKFAEIFEKKAQEAALPTSSSNYQHSNSKPIAALDLDRVPRQGALRDGGAAISSVSGSTEASGVTPGLGRSKSMYSRPSTRNSISSPRPVILTRGPAKAV